MVGAGMGGLCMAKKLRDAGVEVLRVHRQSQRIKKHQSPLLLRFLLLTKGPRNPGEVRAPGGNLGGERLPRGGLRRAVAPLLLLVLPAFWVRA